MRMPMRTTMMLLLMLLLFAMSGGVAACGDSAGELCNSSMTKLCEMACDCTAGDACCISFGGGVPVDCGDLAACEDFWVGLCDRPEEALPPASFFDDCLDGLSETTCLEEGEGSVIMPGECLMDGN